MTTTAAATVAIAGNETLELLQLIDIQGGPGGCLRNYLVGARRSRVEALQTLGLARLSIARQEATLTPAGRDILRLAGGAQ